MGEVTLNYKPMSESITLNNQNNEEKQPTQVVIVGNTHYTILGTAHVSKASAQEVKRLISTDQFDAVAVELDQSRYNNLTNPDSFASMDLFKVVREGKAGMVAASLALGSFQQRIAEQLGIEPGAEMRAAIELAQEKELPILLIDREIGITLRRVYANVPWWQRLSIFSGLFVSVFSREQIKEEDIEQLKEGDMLEATFKEFAEESAQIFRPLIDERDEYMALRLLQENQRHNNAFKNILIVVGAGHLKGISDNLESADDDNVSEVLAGLEHLPKKRSYWKLLPWLITAVILVGFVIGFSRDSELGWVMVRKWVFINGTLAAVGALLAAAHPLTIIGSFFAAPLTSINPLIGAGYVGAGLELWLRKPTVGDFKSLRQDVAKWRGWWGNRVSRTLLVFLLVTLGSAIGTYLGGFWIFKSLSG